MDLGLNNKLALVTGSSVVLALPSRGRLPPKARRLPSTDHYHSKASTRPSPRSGPARTGADLILLVADNATAKGCATTIAKLPSVDILVNNLGIYEVVGFPDGSSDAEWMQLSQMNIMSGVRLSRDEWRGNARPRGGAHSGPPPQRSRRLAR